MPRDLEGAEHIPYKELRKLKTRTLPFLLCFSNGNANSDIIQRCDSLCRIYRNVYCFIVDWNDYKKFNEVITNKDFKKIFKYNGYYLVDKADGENEELLENYFKKLNLEIERNPIYKNALTKHGRYRRDFAEANYQNTSTARGSREENISNQPSTESSETIIRSQNTSTMTTSRNTETTKPTTVEQQKLFIHQPRPIYPLLTQQTQQILHRSMGYGYPTNPFIQQIQQVQTHHAPTAPIPQHHLYYNPPLGLIQTPQHIYTPPLHQPQILTRVGSYSTTAKFTSASAREESTRQVDPTSPQRSLRWRIPPDKELKGTSRGKRRHEGSPEGQTQHKISVSSHRRSTLSTSSTSAKPNSPVHQSPTRPNIELTPEALQGRPSVIVSTSQRPATSPIRHLRKIPSPPHSYAPHHLRPHLEQCVQNIIERNIDFLRHQQHSIQPQLYPPSSVIVRNLQHSILHSRPSSRSPRRKSSTERRDKTQN